MKPDFPIRTVYLDHNGSAPVAEEVIAAMTPWLSCAGNPSSSHLYGTRSKAAVETAREQVAQLINCQPSEIIFTSGGTESDNLAIKGTAERFEQGHIITVATEHPAVLKTVLSLEKHGFQVTVLPVDKFGFVSVEQVATALRADTKLVTVMLANNEVGTIQPVSEISELVRSRGIVMHCDAAQIVGKERVKVDQLKVDLLTIAGHKLNAPKGVGALYIREGLELVPQMIGSGHERGLRSGTLNVLEIVGLGAAAQRFNQSDLQIAAQYRELRDYFEQQLLLAIPELLFNFPRAGEQYHDKRLVNTSNVSFPGVTCGALLAACPAVAAAAGAACHKDHSNPSHVLSAMGYSLERIESSIRFSLGYQTTIDDLDYAVGQLQQAYLECRGQSAHPQ